jgi:hypothetical protein
MLNFIKNQTIYRDKYRACNSDRAAIVSCYFNPENNPYRLKAFSYFYESIKHLPHRIVECTIGNASPQLSGKYITRVHTNDLLWHKETLLNKLITDLPQKYRYVFWLDADVLFTNPYWLQEGVKKLKSFRIIQPFEYCVHLERDELKPKFDLDRLTVPNIDLTEEEMKMIPNGLDNPLVYDNTPTLYNKRVWRSFCSNYEQNPYLANYNNYDVHGHVGFAWGARRELLDSVPLYDKALIGGADHIIAHAAAGQIDSPCITKAFVGQDLTEIQSWSRRFARAVDGQIGYVEGNLFHIWHGDLNKRQYLKRIQEFGSIANQITRRDANGFWQALDDNQYMETYYQQREEVNLDDNSSQTSIESNDMSDIDDCSNNLDDRVSNIDTCPAENYS